MNTRASRHAPGATRELGRLQEIVAVLVRHGLGDAVRRMGWADLLEKAGRLVHWNSAAELARLPPPLQVRRALEELGPTFVKLGQILAGRADLLGPEWITEFEKLHSRVPAVPFEELHAQLVEDLGGEPSQVFAWFDEQPLAAASIAQVHRARLHDGSEVVVKIRRPGIRPVIEADLRLLERLAGIAANRWPDLRPYGPVALVQEFGRSLRRELDLAHECRQAERIAANFSGQAEIVIPKVYWEWTHERVNVQQFIDGLPGSALERAESEGLDRKLLAQRGAKAVLKMVVEDGLFHADPHPGNVFYLPGNRIAFIDFGMVGRLSMQRRDELLKLMLGLVQRDPSAVADVLLEWADGSAEEEMLLNADIEAFVDTYHGVPLAQLSLAAMLADVTAILRRHKLSLPSDLALLIKAFISTEGMGRGLDPDFHMAAEALPLLRRALRARYHPKAVMRRGWQALSRMAGLLGAVPDDLARLLRHVRHGGVQVHIDVHHLDRVGDQLDRAASRLTVGLVVAALIVGSSIVMTVRGGPMLLGLPAFGLLGFVGACAGAVWLLRSIWRSGHHEPRE
ncbi:AarF/ABC1/UbiB kinase family protein [Piscinibacter sp. HJYY11]|uniref:ABC1 kinase family protein n=1 Tax=Piscinibacter sp. HJYY11 TaxID=2801333 RepID=UPI00191E449E|nr:AarF/UbiB family protein [Piscinibacter sp. HJYY11]MBL0726625.1 ubiquinone biosynthesis protein UbiB [Piscinibacter sp. HJYY11]